MCTAVESEVKHSGQEDLQLKDGLHIGQWQSEFQRALPSLPADSELVDDLLFHRSQQVAAARSQLTQQQQHSTLNSLPLLSFLLITVVIIRAISF